MPSPPKKLGLEDTERVRIEYNRGNDFYIRDHPTTEQRLHEHLEQRARDKAQNKSTIDIVLEELEQAVIRKNGNSHRIFPRDKLSEIATPSRLRKILKSLESFNKLPETQQSAYRNRLFSSPDPCWKLLVVLVYNECPEKFVELVADGVSDNCFPLGCGRSPCRVVGHIHKTLDRLRGRDKEGLSLYSYAVCAPYFTSDQGRHVHYVLDSNDSLPFSRSKPDNSSEPGSSRRKQEISSGNENGGFAEVQ